MWDGLVSGQTVVWYLDMTVHVDGLVSGQTVVWYLDMHLHITKPFNLNLDTIIPIWLYHQHRS